jgi:predicted ATPase/DNA-binding CsgD family transcriptional regulator
MVDPVTPLAVVARLSNLPVALTSFVGRERELAELRAALDETRLLTLTGPGGCGKTRLALEVASGHADRSPGGVWWVDLAPVADEALVGAAVAVALGVRPLPGLTELRAACAYLASRRALVVLDNCEHLVAACAEAAEELLTAGSQVTVLATSRAPLAVGGESEWRVPPLSAPDAASFFVARARQLRPGFALTDENAQGIAQICIELDGLPLALELAAARVRMLSVDQIAAGVSESLRLLTGGPRTAVPRLQTLRASVEWSHELASEVERVLLRRLAVFRGGFTLEAVEQVCAGDVVEDENVLDLLGSLVDQSLVIAEEGDSGVRYRLLETVRQYELERLADASDDGKLRDRQCDFFLTLAEHAGPELETGRQAEWLGRLDPEAANFTAAIDWAVSTDPSLALRFCAALYRWWSAGGRFAEGELAYTRALGAHGGGEPALRARAYVGRAHLTTWAGDYRAAEAHATDALALADEAGEPATASRARSQLGVTRYFANPAAARSELLRAAELALAAHDDWALVSARQRLASTYLFESDHTRAARAIEEVASLAERLGDSVLVTRHWLYRGWIDAFDGRLVEARNAMDRVRAALDAVGEPVVEALADHHTAFIDTWQGNSANARAWLPERLERAVHFGAGMVVPWLTFELALAELASDRPKQARNRLEGLVPLVQGRDGLCTSWTLGVLAITQRLLADPSAETTALEAKATAERLGNQFAATFARLTLGRLAAARGDWTVARQHALAHLDACAEGGHTTYVPGCLDALGEVAAGLGSDRDAVRLFAAAHRVRADIGSVRVPPEEDHWAAIDSRLRETLGRGAYEQARVEGAELTIDDALEWARRARGPRRRPSHGWEALTPTEARVAELVAEGLTNPAIGERMFISKATVKTHLAHIFKKLDVHSRAELSGQAARRSNG